MNVTEILTAIEHRSWPMPNQKWKFYQEWKDVLFLHWPVTREQLSAFVPPELELDLYDGKAWVSLLIFDLKKLRPRLLPPVPFLSNFVEINLRTYVKAENKPGIYFLKIEASNGISAKLARFATKLPYVYSKITRKDTSIKASNKNMGSKLQMEFDIGALHQKAPIDSWLTERYVLFQVDNSINKIEIHHYEWPIYDLNLKDFNCNYPQFNTLLKGQPLLTHYSTGVEVVGWRKKEINSELS